MRTAAAPRTPDAELEELLRSALSTAADGFDAPGLIQTTHRRVTRQRRRHAMATVAATGVAAVTVVTAWQAAPPLNGVPEQMQTATQPSAENEDRAGEGDGGSGLALSDRAAGTQGTVDGAPWQATPPPLTAEEQDLGTTEGEVDPSHGAWEIPDPRPTGVAFLDDLGAPRSHSTGVNMAPVDGMVGNDWAQEGGLQPVAGQQWGYWLEGSDYAAGTAYIHITGWADATAAMDGLRDNELYFAWGQDHRAGTWPGREEDPDRFAFETYPLVEENDTGDPVPTGASTSSAVVRTGDYLVSVTVLSGGPSTSEAAAREIAEKSAENLAALDPEHGSD